jgi:hypothetical protein
VHAGAGNAASNGPCANGIAFVSTPILISHSNTAQHPHTGAQTPSTTNHGSGNNVDFNALYYHSPVLVDVMSNFEGFPAELHNIYHNFDTAQSGEQFGYPSGY